MKTFEAVSNNKMSPARFGDYQSLAQILLRSNRPRHTYGFGRCQSVVVSEETKIREILTIESDYYIYRTITKEMI